MKGHVDGGLRGLRIQGAWASIEHKPFHMSFTYPLCEVQERLLEVSGFIVVIPLR
jgi:hypothetical protein